MEETGLETEDLEALANNYDQIRIIFKKKHPEADAVLAQAFEKTISQVLSDLASQKTHSENYHAEVLQAKYKLWNMCEEKLCAYIKTIDPAASKILTEIHNQQYAIFKESSGSNEAIQALEDELLSTKKEMDQILAAAETLENTARVLREENAKLKERIMESPEDLEAQLHELQEENEKYLQKIISLSKEKADSCLSKDSSGGNYAAPKSSREKTREGKRPVNRVSSSSSVKDLSLKQLKEFIEEIYISKEKFDQKCFDTHQAKETMEEYMYSYLNQKYGLKSLIQDWISAIVKSIEKFEAEDPDVLLFAKILRHQIEENYRKVFQEVRKTSLQLLKIHLKNKFPYMQEKAVKDLVNVKTQGELEEEEWKSIVNYMYNPADSNYLLSLLTEHAERNLTRNLKVQGKATLSYNNFVNLLLEFQVTGHDQLLEPFREKFIMIDTDNSGVLTTKQYSELLAILDILEENERLVRIVDPFDTGKITFSDCVSTLLSYQLEFKGNFVSIIYKLYSEKH
ncbi:hypothetical protein SteCoe_19973 [Stentor coeruleus]|uniref:EF-hand domain-containing protein n=1 Tax=Stentor coeruleus TaxID=5963 RepID=A0A1R2BSU1_9CILI|nr:hypothetical protein SteCoe_19973 [Stentor coeruleus]